MTYIAGSPGQQGGGTWREVKDLYDDADGALRDFNAAIERDARFSLKLDHWEGVGQFEQDDPRSVYPTTPHLYDLIRHKWSAIIKQPVYIECLPQDPRDSAEDAETSKRVIESEVFNPVKRFRPALRRMVMGGLAARAWDMATEWHPELGQQGGEVVFRSDSPLNCLVAPGWSDMHDPTCPYIITLHDMLLVDIERMGKTGAWQNTEAVKADGGLAGTGSSRVPSAAGLPRFHSDADPSMKRSSQERAIVAQCWYRFGGDSTGILHHDLPPDEQFMACLDCGHVDRQHPRDGEGNLPRAGLMCPQCQGKIAGSYTGNGILPSVPRMQRITALQEEAAVSRYPNGELKIIALNTPDVVLYEGGWPCKLRSFPRMRFRPYDHMEDPFGLSDTALHKTSQLMLDALERSAYHQAIRNQDVILTKYRGLFDSRHQPFQFSDEHGAIAYWDDPMAAAHTQHFQGSGVSSGTLQAFQLVSGVFGGGRGTGDLGFLTPERSRDIPVGTVQTIAQIGELPIEDAVTILQDELGVGCFGIVLDYAIHYWDQARAVRWVGPDGAVSLQHMKGDDIPNADVLVAATPSIKAAKSEEWAAFQQWLQLGQVDPAAQLVGGQFLGIPPSMIRQYQAERDRLQRAAPAASLAVAAPGTAVASPALPAAIAARMGGGGPPMNGGAP